MSHLTHNGKKYYFLHIPKTGGQTIRRLLRRNVDSWHDIFHQRLFKKPEAYTFTTIRNPLDRLVSTFFYLRAEGTSRGDRKDRVSYNITGEFEDFVNRLASDPEYYFRQQHLKPMMRYINDVEYIDRFMLFDNLEKEVISLYKMITGKDLETIPHRNKGKHKHFETYYTEKTKAIVESIYSEDVKLYQFIRSGSCIKLLTQKKYNMKIFNIGMHKTASCSTNLLLQGAGIKCVQNGENAVKLAKIYDAVSDGDHVDKFHKYYDAYPTSLFLLNTRPMDEWIMSRLKHGCNPRFQMVNANGYFNGPMKYHLKPKQKESGWPPSLELMEDWVLTRQYHHEKIFDFFADMPDRLLVCNINREDWQKKILEFIRCHFHHNIDLDNFREIKGGTRSFKETKLLPQYDTKEQQIQTFKDAIINLHKYIDYDGKELLFPQSYKHRHSFFTYL